MKLQITRNIKCTEKTFKQLNDLKNDKFSEEE